MPRWYGFIQLGRVIRWPTWLDLERVRAARERFDLVSQMFRGRGHGCWVSWCKEPANMRGGCLLALGDWHAA